MVLQIQVLVMVSCVLIVPNPHVVLQIQLLQVLVVVSCVSINLIVSNPTCGFADPAATSSSSGKLCQ